MTSTTTKRQLVCLHSSASSPKQWQTLEDWSGPAVAVTAPPLLGYGPDEVSGPHSSLRRQVARVHETINSFDKPVHLVGHSFGGLVALRYAMMYGHRLASLTVYEPVAFDLLFSGKAPRPDAHSAWRVGTSLIDHVREGRLDVAASLFIDYWNGKGTWAKLPEPQQTRLALRIPTVAWEFKACFNDCPNEDEYRAIRVPCAILSGTESPLSARWISQRLAQLIPGCRDRRIPGLDHMAPVHSPAAVNPMILGFTQSVAARLERMSRAA